MWTHHVPPPPTPLPSAVVRTPFGSVGKPFIVVDMTCLIWGPRPRCQCHRSPVYLTIFEVRFSAVQWAIALEGHQPDLSRVALCILRLTLHDSDMGRSLWSTHRRTSEKKLGHVIAADRLAQQCPWAGTVSLYVVCPRA